ncbi:hypothetical protein BKA70DRAFT_1237207 [Coprinopsis sp. MPI-PUGE-AT-0042]|nr:hypothetical protein BKA70DRAFT_1237207 [Coprinopsis sp. MPI-PUGE-AT-0042]
MATLFSAHTRPSAVSDIGQEYAELEGPWVDRHSWATTSSQGTLFSPEAETYPVGHLLARLPANKSEARGASMLDNQSSHPWFFGDISTLLCASSSQARQLPAKTAQEIGTIMEQQGSAIMTYHAALELHSITEQVLSHMALDRNELFGDGLWIATHLDQLSESQRSAAVDAMDDWEPFYARERPGIMKKLVALVEPRILEERGHQRTR